jgi:NitT/TauT family transport system ATP-binding protein
MTSSSGSRRADLNKSISTDPGSTSGQVLLELDDVSYRYPSGLQAVRGVSFSVNHGSRLGIVGPSGCGKSTLLRLITQLAEPSRGTVRRHYSPKEHRAAVSMVFQEDTLLPWLTVRNNVAIYYLMHPNLLPQKEIEARVDELLVMGGLQGTGHLYPRQLSGGMRRRVAFLAAIAPRPKLLLLDEPFSSVDEPTRVEIHQAVRRILDEFQIATILVTHDLAEAVTLMDQVAILSARPARVAQIKDISLSDTSDLFAVRNTPEFLDQYSQLWDALSHEIRAGKVAMAETQSLSAPI